ncbi:MAG: DNA repair and recombination protein RadA [Candidatus Micrarchaeota archaeon]
MKGENAGTKPADAEEYVVESTPEAVEVKKHVKYKEIEDLPGVGPATASKLKEAGYDSVETIAYCMPNELEEVGGLGSGTAAKVIKMARDSLEMGFETGSEVMKRRELVQRISTGSTELDALFGGGVETQAITECYGKFSSGKSQLGFQLCVMVQKPPEQGGLGGGALFIDTEGTFRPERIVQMAEAHGLDPKEILANIHVARATNSDHQIILLEKAEEVIKTKNIKLVVVDSLTGAFRSDYLGRGELSERQQKLNKHMHHLLRFADRYNIAAYVTNQVMANPGILFGDPTTPIGGHVLAHTSTYRVYLRRSKEDRRIAKMVDSPNLPDNECVFRVTEKGIGD